MGTAHSARFEGLPRLTDELSAEDFAAYVYLLLSDELDALEGLQDQLNQLFGGD